jgi:hypothetical protein
MDFEESLNNILVENLSKLIYSGVKVVDDILFQFDNSLQVVGYTLLSGALTAYNQGRTIGNSQRMMEKHKYFLNKEESAILNEDFNVFSEDYFSDAKKNRIANLDIVTEDGLVLDTKKFFCDHIKRDQSERSLEAAYVDKWIMYNKLFSNKQI